jgi:hypothetical protein
MMDWIDRMIKTQVLMLGAEDVLERFGVTDEEINRATGLLPSRLQTFARLWIALHVVSARLKTVKAENADPDDEKVRALESQFYSLAAGAFLVDPSAIPGLDIEALVEQLEPTLRKAVADFGTTH